MGGGYVWPAYDERQHPIPDFPPYDVRPPHMHGAPTTDDTSHGDTDAKQRTRRALIMCLQQFPETMLRKEKKTNFTSGERLCHTAAVTQIISQRPHVSVCCFISEESRAYGEDTGSRDLQRQRRYGDTEIYRYRDFEIQRCVERGAG